MGVTTAAERGRAAEEFVATQLAKKGFTILARNYTVFSGEIDIIAANNDTLLFVEVKYRRSPQLAIEYLIPRSKQQRIIGAARRFMAHYQRSSQLTCRFDVAIIVQIGNAPQQLSYFANAFTVDE